MFGLIPTTGDLLGYTQAPKGEEAFGVERSTYALFMQPDWYAGCQLSISFFLLTI